MSDQDLRSGLIRLAYQNPELRADLLPLLKTAEPRYRDYVRRYKGPGKPMSKEDWEAKVLGKPKGEKKEKSKSKGEAVDAAVESAPDNTRATVKRLLDGIAAGTPGASSDLNTVLQDFAEPERMRKEYPKQYKNWSDEDFRGAIEALETGQGALIKKVPAPEPSTPGLTPGRTKTYKKKYSQPVAEVMDKHDLTDDDADEVRKFKKGKPQAGVKVSDAELMRRFMQKAKPETKERMKGMTPAEFMKMLAAISEDEEGGGGKTAARYSRDPYWMTAKYPGTDKNGKPFKKGDKVFYYPATKTILTGKEAEAAARDFDAHAFDEDFGSRAAAWENLPKGWTDESVKKFWDSLTGDVKHRVTKCMEQMEGKVDDTGAFCASLADKVDPGWRSRRADQGVEALKPLPEPHTKTKQPRTYQDYVEEAKAEGRFPSLNKKDWENRQHGSAAWGIRESANMESNMSEAELRSSLIRLAADNPEMREHLLPLLASTLRQAHGPVALRDPDAMYYMVEKGTNKSKFYEMKIVPIGQETRAQKSAGNEATAMFVLMRRWGRLTDTGATGRVDSYNEYWDSRRMAETSMFEHGKQRERHGYTDVSRNQEYPIGLGAAGFGWGGQAACAVIPELQDLQAAMQKALVSVTNAQTKLRPIAARDSSMARKLAGMLEGVEASIGEVVTYLSGQLAHCR